MENPIKIQDAHPEKPVRGWRLFRPLEDLFLWADRGIRRLVPAEFNPLIQLGALANMSFLVALTSGILMLFWYVPSVHQAWESLDQMGSLGQLVRSLHRYSSDATIFFVLVHALRMTVGGRFGGARWIAWVTGVALIIMLWFVGWLGYWLVWDVRAQTLALGTARVLEVLPIFTEPMSRSFLTDQSVSSGLFFMIFFFHMMLPLAMGVALWMHISRVSRARFLTSIRMSLWLIAALLVASLLHPATSAAQAEMAVMPEAFSADWWFLLPLMLTKRLSGGMLVALFLGSSILVLSAPWALARGKVKKAVVDPTYCNGCSRCVADCPYDAIVMIPRADEHPRYEIQAEVNPDKCVGCGICAGSCNPGGIGLPQFPAQDERRRIDDWVDQMLRAEQDANIAFLCASSAAADFQPDQNGACEQLPGWRMLAVPCTGWVQPLTLERALRRGANTIMIVGCTPGDPHYREGLKWTEERLSGAREPKLRQDKVDATRIHFTDYNRTEKQRLIDYAADLARLGEAPPADDEVPGTLKKYLGGALVAALFAAPLLLLSDAPALLPRSDTPELVVSIKYRPDEVRECRPMSDAERASTPKHMQSRDGKICERNLPDARLSVLVDGEEVVQRTYPPRGLSKDGPSIGTETIPVEPGQHTIKARIGHSAEPDAWTEEWEGSIDFQPGRREVILYENQAGFDSF